MDWVRWVGWVQRRRSGTQRHYCLSVEQRAGEILRYGDLRSRALHGRETMQELRGLVTANEVWQSACMPKGRSPRCALYPLGHRDDEKAMSRLGAAAQPRNPTMVPNNNTQQAPRTFQPISVGLRSGNLRADRVIMSLHPSP